MIVDTFGGPGGWEEALRLLGRSDVVGLEWDAAACATRAAAGHRTIRCDVSAHPTGPFLGRVEGLIGSPPCPTFSAAGDREGQDEMPHLVAFATVYDRWHDPADWYPWSDPRTPLVLQPLRWAEALQPEWIVLEQVPAVLPLWRAFARLWSTQGYSSWTGILNAADYGVPQTRRRAILIARRHGVAHPPEATHARAPTPSLFGELLPWVSMADALGWGKTTVNTRGDRQTPGGNEFDADDPSWALTSKARSWKLHTNRGQAEDGTRQEVECDRPAPTFTSKSGEQWKLNPGATDTQPNRRRYDVEAEPAPTVAFGHDAANWCWERPSTTVCATDRVSEPGWRGRPEEYLPDGTYTGKRSMDDAVKITVAEALVLQSFRPDYPVQGSRSKQFEQVGNAVPPVLAAAVLGAVLSP